MEEDNFINKQMKKKWKTRKKKEKSLCNYFQYSYLREWQNCIRNEKWIYIFSFFFGKYLYVKNKKYSFNYLVWFSSQIISFNFNS